MAWGRRRSAYYGRNSGSEYSRSYNASQAEENGRLPRIRAAKALGLSPAAFDAGRLAIRYRSSEWHHVGKFASVVDYYDTKILRGDPGFWIGAAENYRSAKKKSELMDIATQLHEAALETA